MNLYDTAKAYTKKDITSLDIIDLKKLDVKKQAFEKNGQKGEFNYVEIDGYKYVVKAAILDKIKQTIEYRPTTTKVKIAKNDKGEYNVIPLD